MLFVVSPVGLSTFLRGDLEVAFELNERRMVEASVYARNFKDGNDYCTFVGKLPYSDALLACDMPEIPKGLLEEGAVKKKVYRDRLRVSWANRAKYKLKLDTCQKEAIVLISDFERKVLISSKAMKRKPRAFGGFGLVQLGRNERLTIDDRQLVYTGLNLDSISVLDEPARDELVDCTGILNRGTILAPTVSLF